MTPDLLMAIVGGIFALLFAIQGFFLKRLVNTIDTVSKAVAQVPVLSQSMKGVTEDLKELKTDLKVTSSDVRRMEVEVAVLKAEYQR